MANSSSWDEIERIAELREAKMIEDDKNGVGQVLPDFLEDPFAEQREAAANSEESEGSEEYEDKGVESESEEEGFKKVDADEFLASDMLGRKVRAKINGEEREVSVEEILRIYQKNEAADKKLSDASAKERSMLEKERELLDREHKLVQELEQSVRGVKAASEDKRPSTKDGFKTAANSIFEGDEEKTAQLLESAIDDKFEAEFERRMKSMLPELERKAVSEAQRIAPQIQLQMQWDMAVKGSVDKNPEIFSDPILQGAWKSKLDEAYSRGLSPTEAVSAADKGVRDWMGKFKGEESKGLSVNKSDLEKREERKREAAKMDVSSKASAKVKTSKKEEEKEESVSDIIRAMRESRGLT